QGKAQRRVPLAAVAQAADIGPVVVPCQRPSQLAVETAAAELAAGAEVTIFQALRRGGAELVVPSVEGMQRGQRGLHGDRAIAAETLPAGAQRGPALRPAGFQQPVVETEIGRIARMIRLPRVFRSPAEALSALPGGTGPTQAIGSGGSGGDVAVVVQVGITDQLLRAVLPREIQQMAVEIALARQPV